jgi:hypothetical protein
MVSWTSREGQPESQRQLPHFTDGETEALRHSAPVNSLRPGLLVCIPDPCVVPGMAQELGEYLLNHAGDILNHRQRWPPVSSAVRTV